MSLLTNFARGVKVELIAKLATSYEAYDGGTVIKGVARHNIRDYFRKYGSTARRFDHIAEDDIYIGYVRMSYKPEFLSAIILAGENAVAVSFDSEVGESNDFLTLMAKKEFADRMTVAVQRAASFMRKPTSPPAPQPQAKPIAPPPTAPAQKSNDALGWMALLAVGAIFGAIFIIPLLGGTDLERMQAEASLQTNQQDAPSMNGQPYDALSAPPEAPPENRLVEEDVPTVGQVMDAAKTGVDAFVAAYKDSGMSGAVEKSIECHNVARASPRIVETDKCAALDYAAKYFDESITSLNGWPTNPYYADLDSALHHAYSRFPSYSEMRLSIIRSEALGLLQELPPTAFD